jgi:hypothetical protein
MLSMFLAGMFLGSALGFFLHAVLSEGAMADRCAECQQYYAARQYQDVRP